ncbi:MAG TPA: HisA/HisF-related TIM barrel protein [Candidatus Limnocylindrales bacterium]|nr:HisA/HisF-related TIM barrel protein [Candidatus Limnocylindrales bacterium]
MQLIPAIDLIGGRAVRLVRGDYRRQIETSADPIELACALVAGGARRLHVVDLEGARSGRPCQIGVIGQLASATRAVVAGTRIQVGGGLRSVAAIEAVLSAGADDVVLGSAALADPSFAADCAARWPGRIGVALDLRGGRLSVDGWLRELDDEPVTLAELLVDSGAARLVVTDVERDGTGAGPNVELITALRHRLPPVELIASGGVAATGHLRHLARADVDGAIVGRALLEGTLDLAEALAACRAQETPA